MGDIDNETNKWLKSLKLSHLTYYSDFENGYYLGVIFEKLNLAKGRKFKDSKDMACKFQNFKNVRDLLFQNFKVEFPIQNIFYNIQNLLTTLKDSCIKYNQDKKQATFRKIQNFSQSKIEPKEQKVYTNQQKQMIPLSKMSQTGKFPKKIQQIELKLQKYKEMKTKHELFALQDRKKELEQNRKLIEEHRLYEINKVRSNHLFAKQHEKRVFEIWAKTNNIKNERIERDNTLKQFLEDKKSKFYQSIRNEEVKSFDQGLQAFQLNCIRQGIQLEPDPDRPKNKTEDNFNKQVFLDRIKDNIKNHEKQRKQRIKRQNKKVVDAKEANLKAQVIWTENNLIQSYANKMNEHLSKCVKIQKVLNQEIAEKETIKRKYKDKKFTQLPEANINEQLRAEQLRRKRIVYLDQKVERLQRRQRKHRAIAENVLDALIHIVIQNQDNYSQKGGFSFLEWKRLQEQFIHYKKKETIFKTQSKFLDPSYTKNALEYIDFTGQWSQDQCLVPLKLSKLLSNIIDKACPPNMPPQKPKLPLHVPIKIGFLGDSLSGKTTIAQKICHKYGLILINPVQLINEAFDLNKQPVAEDPKKKKDSKKPQEQNPQKLALKQWGEKIMKTLDNPKNASIDHFIEAIKFKLTSSFEYREGLEVLTQYQKSKELESERFNKALKQYEQIQKKGKKDSKKGGAVEADEPPTEKKYFYTKGFIIDGIDLSLQNLKKIERNINGFISFDEQINKQAEIYKQKFSHLIPLELTVRNNDLQQGTFDLLIHLEVPKENLQNRNNGRKLDPQTQTIYHLTFNPPPTDVKGLAERLIDLEKLQIQQKNYSETVQFYSVFGDEKSKIKAAHSIDNSKAIQESLSQINSLIQHNLDSKYEFILNLKSANDQESNQKQPQQQQKQSQKVNTSPSVQTMQPHHCSILIKRFNLIYESYSSKVTQCLYEFDIVRQSFAKELLSVQQHFINIINRPDDKAGKILSFQENYNKLLAEKTNIVKDSQASKHLISKLDELYDSLWVSLEAKKNEAVAERQRVINSPWINQQVKKVIEISKKLIENELTLLVQIIFFILNANGALQGALIEIPTEFLVLGIPPDLEPVQSFEDKHFTSERLEYYTFQAEECLKQLQSWLGKKQKKFKMTKLAEISSILDQFIENRKKIIKSKIIKIINRTKQIYLEEYCMYKALVNKMDDWIIVGIRAENQFVYDIYKNIKKNIQEAKQSVTKDLFVKEITDTIHPISSLPLNQFPIVRQTQKNKIKVLSFAIFMQEIKYLATGGRILFKTFKTYFEKRKRSGLLQKQFLCLQFDIMQQYLVTDDYCNYRQVATAMLLWKFKVIDQENLNQYQKILSGEKIDSSLNNQMIQSEVKIQFGQTKNLIKLEQFKIMSNFCSEEEERILKHLLFEIFRQDYSDTVNIKDYIDTLRLFVQLQVEKYGDSLMIIKHDVAHRKTQHQ